MVTFHGGSPPLVFFLRPVLDLRFHRQVIAGLRHPYHAAYGEKSIACALDCQFAVAAGRGGIDKPAMGGDAIHGVTFSRADCAPYSETSFSNVFHILRGNDCHALRIRIAR